MRVIFLSDLHITSASSPETSPWVQHFCDYLCSTCAEPIYIFVLGDIITGGDELAFQAASAIFDFIKHKLQFIDHHFFFLPGNHDYCCSNLTAFQSFVDAYQSKICPIFNFLTEKTWNIAIEETNFIVTDSINNGQYDDPGILDVSGIKRCSKPNLKNILLLHHSIEFEDGGNHTGIVNKQDAIACFQECIISHIFHGHAHATRNLGLPDQIFHLGVGSIGLVNEKLSDLVNEQDQFLEIQISGKYVESVTNWIFRGGEQQYRDTVVFPQTVSYYKNRADVLITSHDAPSNYIDRYVLTREQACKDDLWLAFNKDKRIKLSEAIQSHSKVLLVSDAGLGKSTELRNLAAMIPKSNPYILPVFLSLNLYTGDSILEYLYSRYPNYKGLNPVHFLLILDGFEEMENPHHFKRALSRLLLEHPKIRICISMRSNFLLNSSDTFNDFAIYQLLPLFKKDIINTLKQHSIDVEVFLRNCKIKRLSNLLDNPFYLNEIIALFLENQTLPLPHDLMKQIIELRISKDSLKFEYAKAKTLEESKYELQTALTKLALGMQLLNSSHCPESEYHSILADSADRELVKFSSLLVKNQTGFEFSHNIFREYLVAQHLSQRNLDDILSLVSLADKKYINHNWFNVLGLLLQIHPDKALFDWVKGTEPLLLVRLESDRITDTLRFELLKATIEDIETRNVWFGREICTEEQLAVFCQTKETLELLLDHISSPAHFRSLYFCLNVLSNFTNCYGLDKQVVQTLMKCSLDSDLRSDERRTAISAIADLGLASKEITGQLMSQLSSCDDTYIRTGLYEHLLVSKQVDDHVDFLLAGLRCASRIHSGKIANGAESFYLNECFSLISSPQAIKRILSWYSKKENRDFHYFSKDAVFYEVKAKAIECFRSGVTDLFDLMYNFLLAASASYSSSHVDYAIDFFIETSTAEQAFTCFLDFQCLHKDFIMARFIEREPVLLDYFCDQYTSNKLKEDKVFESFANSWGNRIEFYKKCAPVLEAKTGTILPPPVTRKSYAELEQNDTQQFFDALFDRSRMGQLLKKLLSILDNPDITISELSKLYLPFEQYPSGTHELHYAIIYHGAQNSKVKDFLSLIHWDSFVLERIHHLIDQKNSVSVSKEQVTFLQKTFNSLLLEIDYHHAFSENEDGTCSLSGNLFYCIFLKKHFDFGTPQEFFLGLLETPYHFMDVHDVVGKYNYLEQHLPKDTIKRKISELLVNENRDDILADLLFGCKRYRLYDGKDLAISCCKKSSIPAYRKRNSIEYLKDVFGEQILMEELIPNVDDPTFDAILTLLGDDAVQINAEIIKQYKRRKSLFLLQHMITMNLPEGLSEFIKESKRLHHPVDANNNTSNLSGAISNISSPSLIPLLCEAAEMCLSDDFEDVSFHSLYTALYNAFQKCANNDFHATITALEELKTNTNGNKERIGFCNITLDAIQSANREKMIKAWTIPEVRQYLQSVH